jgi:hypothetical protein
VRAGLALIVIFINIIAIVSVLGARSTVGRKLAWTAAIVLLPFAGAFFWVIGGRRR